MSTSITQHPIIELFGPTVQGEGALCGQPTHFLRLAGCGYRCSWCDSMHAVSPQEIYKNRTMMFPSNIVDQLLQLPAVPWVTLTGGDPCIHDLEILVGYLQHEEFKIAVETQGQLWQQWLLDVDHVTISPKGPSSGMDKETDFDVLDKYLWQLSLPTNDRKRTACVKIVVFVEHLAADLKFAKTIFHRYIDSLTEGGDFLSYYISVGTRPNRYHGNGQLEICADLKEVTESVLKDAFLRNNVTAILPQMHVLMWGQEKGR